ncbi:MAG: ribosome biogenesis/translation initiation ATPase RLI [Candidatus Methanomethylicia archaeon]
MRIAVLDRYLCKPKDCGTPCIKFCPKNRAGVKTIFIDESINKPRIIESLCVGCGICIKKCPFKALEVVNLPEELEENCIHRYGPNSFKLYKLPIPRPGLVLGLIGPNGTGKTTVLQILSGEIIPNLGMYDVSNVEKYKVIEHFKGTELQTYFRRLFNGEFKTSYKPQNIINLHLSSSIKVSDLIETSAECNVVNRVKDALNLGNIWNHELNKLSGGELQRVAIASACVKDADVYLIDEPTSYLDVYERIKVAKFIRSLISKETYIIIVEHDLAVLDYLSDIVCILYGKPGVYGIVSNTYGVRTGINAYLEGYLPMENIRIRKESIQFTTSPPLSEKPNERKTFQWGSMKKILGTFRIEIEPGQINRGEIIGILGPNGIGKTTFIKLIAGLIQPDEGYSPTSYLKLRVSYKPQYLSPPRNMTVKEFFDLIFKEQTSLHSIRNELIDSLNIETLYNRKLKELSGGELQKVAITGCLLRDAHIYLIDEPSAFLDIEQRLLLAKMIRKIILMREASAFVVEHDIILVDFIADSLITFTGSPGVFGLASSPMKLRNGMNQFLKTIGITFRRDKKTKRPRVNKEGAYLDRLQKEIGEYYYFFSDEEK